MPRATNRADIHHHRLLERNKAIPQRDTKLENNIRVPVRERVGKLLRGDGGDVARGFGERAMRGDEGVLGGHVECWRGFGELERRTWGDGGGEVVRAFKTYGSWRVGVGVAETRTVGLR